VERNDELLCFAEGDLVRGGSSPASLAHALADIVRHAPRGALHLAAKVCFSVRKARDDRAYPSVEVQGATVYVELVQIVLARSFHMPSLAAAAAVLMSSP